MKTMPSVGLRGRKIFQVKFGIKETLVRLAIKVAPILRHATGNQQQQCT